MESKSSTTSTPRTALKVSITKKVNDRLKNDLKELEKVSMPKIKPYLDQKSPRKNPILKDNYISIDELRSRPHHGTLGVIPVRKSHELDELKFLMKGKNVTNTSLEALNAEEDEGINEPAESASDTDSEQLRSNQNTPNSLYAHEAVKQINRQNFLSYFYSQPKPAILPSTGTTSSAKFAQRPKPQKKQKIILKPLKKPVQYDMVSLDSAKTEMEIQQEELEREVKSMVDEAKKIANIKKKKNLKPNKKEADLTPEQNLEDKKIVKGVEGLITAIKSGQLVSEQEQSNKKIQEILGTVLDKTSLSLFDPSFSENMDEEKELNERSMVDSAINADSMRDSQGVQSVRTMTENFDLDNEEKFSADNDTHTDAQTVKSMLSSYQDEIDAYLANLPAMVTKEDVLNTTATSLKLIERPRQKEEAKKSQIVSTDEKYARNLHLFCMLEHERRDSMLLPDELRDVTRKYHVRSKYENKRKESAKRSDSFVSQQSIAKFNDQFIAYNRTDRAAKRVFDNLTDLMHFDEKKSYSTIDSGYEDSELDMWKKKADQSLELEGKKVNMNMFEDYREFTLTFLKPAPPKMSVKPSKIRERLFAEYKSMAPPVDDMNLLEKGRKKLKFSSNETDDLLTQEDDDADLSDQESVDESALEFQFILNKLLNRQYCSESDLSKLDNGENNLNINLTRSLSDTVFLRSKQNVQDVYDYDFLRINSNYNEALEEAGNQKKIIKNDYLRKSRLNSASVSSLKTKTNTKSVLTKESADDENIDNIQQKVFFPKSKYLFQNKIL